MTKRCALCGTPVEQVGTTTQSLAPLITPEAVAELKKRADAMAEWIEGGEWSPDVLDAYRELTS